MVPRDWLYMPIGATNVFFEGVGVRFYLAITAAHVGKSNKKFAIAEANPLERGGLQGCNERTIYQMVILGICDSAQLLLGLTIVKPGSVQNTMPPHLHDRRSAIYFHFDLRADDEVCNGMGEPDSMRHIVMATEESVISTPWPISMGSGTRNCAFIWAMGAKTAIIPT